jgi:hypothetical protein
MIDDEKYLSKRPFFTIYLNLRVTKLQIYFEMNGNKLVSVYENCFILIVPIFSTLINFFNLTNIPFCGNEINNCMSSIKSYSNCSSFKYILYNSSYFVIPLTIIK